MYKHFKLKEGKYVRTQVLLGNVYKMCIWGGAILYVFIYRMEDLSWLGICIALAFLSAYSYYVFKKIEINPEDRTITRTQLWYFKKTISLDQFVNFEIVQRKGWGIIHHGYDINLIISPDKEGEEDSFSIADIVRSRSKTDAILHEIQSIFNDINLNDPTAKEYNLLPAAFLERIYNHQHDGYTEEEIAETEKRLGIKLPSLLREYFARYANLSLSTAVDPICELERVDFTFNWLDNEREDFEEIYGAPIEELKARTTNYLVFWTENQGCWQAGIKEEDLWRDNPPVYMTVDESILEWQQVNDNLQSFLLCTFWDNAEDCDDLSLEKSEVGDEILQVIRMNHIDPVLLKPTYAKHLATCWDNHQSKFFMFLNRDGKGELSELKILTA